MSTDPAIHCGILLAAGRSSRFGSDKLLHALPDGTAIAVASARTLKQVLNPVVAVVRRDNQALWQLLQDEGIEIVAAPVNNEGVGSSLAAGIAVTPDAAGWVVALADMPFIKTQTISQVLGCLHVGAPLVAPIFNGQRGHPVGFSSSFRQELLALTGDEGARHVLREHLRELILIDCNDSGIVRDIDVVEDIG